ncbi:hypothetical protein QBC39DRAFT_10141 [Podospora conica]|nr:hypothetical protein QBC39DRAFT_10141 [Schizothecium conicum]
MELHLLQCCARRKRAKATFSRRQWQRHRPMVGSSGREIMSSTDCHCIFCDKVNLGNKEICPPRPSLQIGMPPPEAPRQPLSPWGSGNQPRDKRWEVGQSHSSHGGVWTRLSLRKKRDDGQRELQVIQTLRITELPPTPTRLPGSQAPGRCRERSLPADNLRLSVCSPPRPLRFGTAPNTLLVTSANQFYAASSSSPPGCQVLSGGWRARFQYRHLAAPLH